VFSKTTPEATTGTLLLDAYVRHVGLCANQIVAVPGAGDFNIERIWAGKEQVPQREGRHAGMVVLDEQQDLELLAQADEDKCVSHLCFDTQTNEQSRRLVRIYHNPFICQADAALC
jgi:hypothetical protein